MDDIKIRDYIKGLDGSPGKRSIEVTDLLKLKLAAAMFYYGEMLYNDIKRGGDPFANDPNIMGLLKDLSCLINEFLMYEFND